jgi:hypothetical protein
VIAPLDSRLCILNPVNHFSTHLRPAKEKPYGYTFALIPLFHVHLLMLDHHNHHFMCITTSCDLVAITLCHILLHHVCCLCLTHSTWYNSISNLVSLITKTKLGLSMLQKGCTRASIAPDILSSTVPVNRFVSSVFEGAHRGECVLHCTCVISKIYMFMTLNKYTIKIYLMIIIWYHTY